MASRYLSRLRSTDPSPTTRRTRQRTTGAPSSTGWKAKTQLWMRRVAGLPETPLPRGDRDGVAELKATRSGRLVMKESAEKGASGSRSNLSLFSMVLHFGVFFWCWAVVSD